jgi:hypothetical protein
MRTHEAKMIDVGDVDRGARTLGNPQYVIT